MYRRVMALLAFVSITCGHLHAGTTVTVTDEAGLAAAFADESVEAIVFEGDVTLTGTIPARPGTAAPLTIDGGGRTLDLDGQTLTLGGTLASIARLTVANGAGGYYGAINAAAVTGGIGSGTVFLENAANGTNGAFGGALSADSFAGGITGARFEKNTATATLSGSRAFGGALYVDGTFRDSIGSGTVFLQNTASAGSEAQGGAVHIGSFEDGITGAHFEKNTATATDSLSGASGGALYVDGTFKGGIGAETVFLENTAYAGLMAQGGAVFVGSLEEGITGAHFEKNTATATYGTASGGALFANQAFTGGIGAGTVFFQNAVSAGQVASGGAVDARSFEDGITGARFEKNTATATDSDSIAYGGALNVGTIFTGGIRAETVFLENTVTAGSEAQGGAVRAGSFEDGITGALFEKNTATATDTYGYASGGALYVEAALTGGIRSGTEFLQNAAFAEYQAQGGAVYAGSFAGGITGAYFKKNTATTTGVGHGIASGGALFAEGAFTGGIRSGTEFLENTVTSEMMAHGGAVYAGSFAGGITGARFMKNTATATGSSAYGGALYVEGIFKGGIGAETVFFENTVTAGYQAYGGAVRVGSFEDGITSAHFEKNTATGTGVGHGSASGGALFVEGAFTGGIRFGTEFLQNAASAKYQAQGGAVYADSFEGGITGAYFKKNTATTTGSGYASANGGALYVDTTFTGGIGAETVFLENSASAGSEAQGGAVRVGSFEDGLTGAHFEKNTATATASGSSASGGALYVGNAFKGGIGAGTVFLENEVSADFVAFGGAVSVGSFEDGITGAHFEKNTATTNGIYSTPTAYGGALYVRDAFKGGIGADTVFLENTASASGHAQGGAVRVGSFEDGITGARFEKNAAKTAGNDAHAYGGALYVASTFKGGIGAGTDFLQNAANGVDSASGGAVYAGSFEDGITGAHFVQNTATATRSQSTAYGGALYVYNAFKGGIRAGTVFLENTASANRGAGGGAVYARSFEDGITGAHFEKNTATATGSNSIAYGGAVQVGSFAGGITGARFVENTAKITGGNGTASGGALSVASTFKGGIGAGTVFFENTVTAGHQAQGGAVYAGSFEDGITGAHFQKNEATAKDSDSTAYGGALFVDGAFKGGIGAETVFFENTVTAGHQAQGGAVRVGSFEGGITGAHFEKNEATANGLNGYAYGGALYADQFTGRIGLGTSFLNNRADGSLMSFGGAIFVGTSFAAASAVTLDAGSDKVVFQGNSAGGRANSLHFGRRLGYDSNANASLDIRTEAGGTVALYDPVSVDMSGGTTFAMTVSGGGEFIWGGANDFAAQGGSTVGFQAGSRTVLVDGFQLSNRGDRSTVDGNNQGGLAITFAAGSRFTVDLTGREQDDAFFYQHGAEPVTMSGTMTIDRVQALTFKDMSGKYLLADDSLLAPGAGYSVDSGSGLFSASLLEEGGKSYIVFSNAGVVAATTGNANRNVATGFAVGAYEDAWARYLASDDGAAAGNDVNTALFMDILSRPETYLGEAAVSFMGQAMAWQTAVSTGVRRLELASRDLLSQAPAATEAALASLRVGASPFRAWGGYLGGRDRHSASDGYFGYKSHFNGGAAGLSWDALPGLTLGASYTHAVGFVKSGGLASEAKSVMDGGGVFASLAPAGSRWNFAVDASFGHYDNRLTRRNASGSYRADYDQGVWSFGGRAGYRLETCGFAVSPYAAFRYQHLRQDGFNESGGPLAFRLGRTSADSAATSLGVEVGREYRFANGGSVSPLFHAAWRHEFADRHYAATGGFTGAPIDYRLNSVKTGRDALELGLGLRARLVNADRWSLDAEASYTLDLRDKMVSQSWYAGLGMGF